MDQIYDIKQHAYNIRLIKRLTEKFPEYKWTLRPLDQDRNLLLCDGEPLKGWMPPVGYGSSRLDGPGRAIDEHTDIEEFVMSGFIDFVGEMLNHPKDYQ